MDDITKAVQLLEAGKVVAFPTETVYGLGAHAFHKEGIETIFHLKGRARDNPLILHIYHLDQVNSIARTISPLFYRLAERFFPGPLTVVLPKQPEVSQEITAGLDTVAFRMPAHPVARQLLQSLNAPIAAPSANLSGRPSPTCREHVLEDFPTQIPLILEGGVCEVGIESTVLDLSSFEPTLLRPGSITKEELEDCLSLPVSLHSPQGGAAKAPGMKYRHYAPKANVSLFFTWDELLANLSHAKNPLILSTTTPPYPYERVPFFSLSREKIYSQFRLADQKAITEIFVLCSPDITSDLALMNRLKLAARG